MPIISYTRVVHLSHAITAGPALWPGDPPVSFETVATVAQDGYALRRVSLGEHAGTNLNAPRAFSPSGMGVDAYPAEALVLPAVVMDARSAAAADPDYALSVGDIALWEEEHGAIREGAMVLVWTGWSDRWDDPTDYLGTRGAAGGGQLQYPGISEEAARHLVTSRRAGGIGIDTAGVDPGYDASFATNRTVLATGGLVLENLTDLRQLPPSGATLFIGALRLEGGSGAPATVLALVP